MNGYEPGMTTECNQLQIVRVVHSCGHNNSTGKRDDVYSAALSALMLSYALFKAASVTRIVAVVGAAKQSGHDSVPTLIPNRVGRR